MNSSENKAWAYGKGIMSRSEGKYIETLFGITLENMNINVGIDCSINQIHLTLGRKEMILLRDAINRVLDKEVASK